MFQTFATRFIVGLGILLSCILGPVTALAQSYPARLVTIVVPNAPGNAGDITTRIFAKKLNETYKQPVIVLNRPGAANSNAAVLVGHAKPDGYTVFVGGSGTAISSQLFKSLPYKLSDFKPVTTVAFFDLVIVVNQDSPFKSINDLVQYAKANPGKLNIGTVSIGTTQNLSADLFKTAAAINLQVVPFNSTSELISALHGKDIQAALEILPGVLSQISSHQLRALAVTSSSRSTVLPDVPTLAESGLKNFDVRSWSGLFVPVQTPDAVVKEMATQSAAVVTSADVKQQMQSLGAEAMASTPDQMSRRLTDDVAKWKEVIDRQGIGGQ